MLKITLTNLRVSLKPEVKTSANGKTYSSIIASSNSGKDKDGNARYVNVRLTVFGKTAERSAELDKGSYINAVGNVTEVSHYTKNDGSISTTLEVTADMIETPYSGGGQRNGNEGGSNGNQYNQSPRERQGAPAMDFSEPDPEADLPF